MSHQYSATGSSLHSPLISLQTASASATEAPGHHLGLSTPQWRPLHSHAIPVLLNPDVPLRARPDAICKKDLPFFFFWCSLYSKSHFHYLGLPRWHSGEESACQCQRHKKYGFDPWIGKIPWSRKWQLTPVFLPRKWTEEPGGLPSMGSPKSRTWLSNSAQHAYFHYLGIYILFPVEHWSLQGQD